MMKYFKMSLFFALLSFSCIAVIGQRSKRGRAAALPKVVCDVRSVPKGFIVVGYKPVQTCGGSPELVTKRPEETDVVCAGSPIPDGYTVISRAASAACQSGDANPLTNALFIARSDVAVVRNAVPAAAERGVAVNSTAGAVQVQTQIELAVLHHEIKVGMTTDQVLASWGRPGDADASTQSGSGTTRTWTYYRGGEKVYLYFREDTLTSYSWDH